MLATAKANIKEKKGERETGGRGLGELGGNPVGQERVLGQLDTKRLKVRAPLTISHLMRNFPKKERQKESTWPANIVFPKKCLKKLRNMCSYLKTKNKLNIYTTRYDIDQK